MKQQMLWLGLLALGSGALLSMAPWDAPGMNRAGAQPDPLHLNRFIDADRIRVGISDDSMQHYEYPGARISATGPFTVRDDATGGVLFVGRAGDRLDITVNAAGFTLKPLPAGAKAEMTAIRGPIAIAPDTPDGRLKILTITRRKEIPEYRGAFQVVRSDGQPNKLTVINIVDLEDYLKAVVPNELPARYGMEAVKAQAVAARNYAIRPREKSWHAFDICDSQLCQVYFGSQSETLGGNRAVDETEGLVGLYDGEPILALFSSAHGGYAEAYANAFSDPKTKRYPAPPIPYLTGGPDVPELATLDLTSEAEARRFWTDATVPSYDVDSPYYRWEKHWNAQELQSTFERGVAQVSAEPATRNFVSPRLTPGQHLGALKNIRVLERGKSGKAMVVAIDTENDCWILKKEFLIRKVFSFNGRMLPSANVVFTPERNAQGKLTGLLAQGGGFGHGVGMSQLGASWMSRHGRRFPEILQHYYQGVSLGSIPVSVGGDKPCQATYTRFETDAPYGRLWIRDDTAGRKPVTVQINGKTFVLTPTGLRTAADIHTHLKPGQLNTLVLFPDRDDPDRKLIAWVELYPPQDNHLRSPTRPHQRRSYPF